MALNYCSNQPARVRYFVCGHFHKPGTIGDMDGELIVNGPWVATDAYCFNRFSGFTEPVQLIHGVNEKYGVTWRLPVRLRSPDEKAGPKRYKIDLSSEEGLVQDLGGQA
jgi:3',5'-cyclic AMP phosphodiesterase CpdA